MKLSDLEGSSKPMKLSDLGQASKHDEAEKDKGFLSNALAPIKAIPGDIAAEFKEGQKTVAESMPKPGEAIGNPFMTVLGGMQEAVSPLSGTVKALVGDPVRNVLPQDTSLGRMGAKLAEDVAGIAMPGAAVKSAGKIAKGAAKGIMELAESELADVGRVAAQRDASAGVPGALKRKLAYAEPHEEAVAAHRNGFVTVPREAAKEGATATSEAMSGLGGKYKLYQVASEKNQKIAQAHAASDLGLPPKTTLSPAVLDQVIAREAASYDAIRNEMPTLMVTDKFKQTVSDMGGIAQKVRDAFPGVFSDYSNIDAFGKSLATHETIQTDVAMEMIRGLRKEATDILKSSAKQGGEAPGVVALGLAKRRAANALEEMIDENLTDAPNVIGKLKTRIAEANALADKAIAEANVELNRAETIAAYSPKQAAEMRRLAQSEIARAEAAKTAALARNSGLEAAESALQSQEERESLISAFRDSRQKIAKAYDLKLATSPLGEVNSRRLGALQAAGKPMTGGLGKIASAQRSFPKEFQTPSSFGGTESLSVLDILGGAAALGTGHPGVLGLTLARPAARMGVLSPSWQNAMLGTADSSEAMLNSIYGKKP